MFLLSIGLASGCIAFVGAYAAFWRVLAPSPDEVDGVTVIAALGLSILIATVSAVVMVLFLKKRV
jgi:hypothetical protein